jgi:CBS domain-containing membrane protein
LHAFAEARKRISVSDLKLYFCKLFNMSKRLKRTMRMAKVVMYKETLIDFKEHLWTFIGSFMGVGIIGFVNNYYLQSSDTLFLVGSFGASSVLIYGVINSPLAQPRNLIGGHVISALVGVTLNYLITEPWLAAALAVSVSIV